jgi:hypothetical protein
MQVRLLRPLAARVALAAVMGAAVTSPAWAQTGGNPATAASLGIVPGARARLIVADYGEDPQTGTITAVRGDSFVFRRDKSGDSLTVGYTHVARLDVGRGRHARTLTGFVVGLVGGGAAGAALGAATYHAPSCSSSSNPFCGLGLVLYTQGRAAEGGAVLGAAGGALLGTVIGAVIHTERWHTVPINGLLDHPRADIAVIPSQSGPRLALRLAARF